MCGKLASSSNRIPIFSSPTNKHTEEDTNSNFSANLSQRMLISCLLSLASCLSSLATLDSMVANRKSSGSSDVIVVGGGLIGCAIAYRLARMNVRVAVFERGAPGC
ncbi:MAG: FAD-dependent oxidoreductase, partial [Terriglobia bacterium]